MECTLSNLLPGGISMRSLGGLIWAVFHVGHKFCFHCGEDAHRPASCEDVERYVSGKIWLQGRQINALVRMRSLAAHPCTERFWSEIQCRWNEKNSAESENVTWIIANTKKCPKCRKPIEKNQGCNHMTCHKNVGGCGHEFCWLCMGDWKDHGQETGGYYRCNKVSPSVCTHACRVGVNYVCSLSFVSVVRARQGSRDHEKG